jgi:anti-sigma regulatory factor (Ser/Thr protein kinase)
VLEVRPVMTLASPARHYTRTFVTVPDQVAQARAWLDTTVTSDPADVPSESTATAALLLSEAITNAIRHTASAAVTVTTTVEQGHLSVEVDDDGSGTSAPTVRTTDLWDDHGRGMALIAAFADTWRPLTAPRTGIAYTLTWPPHDQPGEAMVTVPLSTQTCGMCGRSVECGADTCPHCGNPL